MKNVDVIGVSSGIIGVILAVFIVDKLCWRIVISLIIVTILLLAKVIIQNIEYNKLNKQYEELQKRHSALTEQYRKKEAKLEVAHDYWGKLGLLLAMTKTGSQRERFNAAYDDYLELTAKIHMFTEE